METIIQHIVVELLKKILKKAEAGGMWDIHSFTAEVVEDCKEAAVRIVETIVSQMNQELRADKEGRKERGLVLKEKDRPRALLTDLGMLHLQRDYYRDTRTGRYSTPLDQMLNIKGYERVGAGVSAGLVNAAAEVSYAKSAAGVTGGQVSRQTVHNKILEAAVPEKEPAEENRKVKELHVYADEAHVPMQRPGKQKGKQKQVVPLVTVTEGTKQDGNGRKQTIRPMHFTDQDLDSGKLWDAVSGYIGVAYETEQIERICVHADGGKWIQRGLEEYAQRVHVLDEYHMEKKLHAASRGLSNRNYRERLRSALRKEDRKKADAILQEMLDEAGGELKKEKAVRELGTYLMNHWEAACRRYSGEDIPGSCTEGQVSHVLAERFSRNPMGWSRPVLGRLACVRVYVKNGGKMEVGHFREQGERQEAYGAYAEKMLKKAISGHLDWSIFETERLCPDLASGTQHLIRAMGESRNLLN